MTCGGWSRSLTSSSWWPPTGHVGELAYFQLELSTEDSKVGQKREKGLFEEEASEKKLCTRGNSVEVSKVEEKFTLLGAWGFVRQDIFVGESSTLRHDTPRCV